MPKKIKLTKVKNNTGFKNNKNTRGSNSKNTKIGKNASNSCPVGKVCFGLELNVRHLSILLLLVVIIVLVSLFYIHYRDNQTVESNNLLSNFQNIGLKRGNNQLNKPKTMISNSTNNSDNDSDKKSNITINYHLTTENKSNLITPEILHNQPIVDSINTLINKDYERVINPLEPPERRNFHMQATGLERLAVPQGIPINIPTRGYTGGIMQVGVLHKEEVSDDTKKIGQNTEPVILPLYGRPTYNGSNKWSYYTSTDKMNQVKLPISNKNKVCNSEYGCEELYNGDNVTVPAYNGDFKVSIYEFDKPRYIPYV